MDAVRRSSHQFDMPDTELGHGIPDFMLADRLLEATTSVGERDSPEIIVYPVPFQDALTVVFPAMEGGTVELQLFDPAGRSLWMQRVQASAQGVRIEADRLAHLQAGTYILRMDGGAAVTVLKLP